MSEAPVIVNAHGKPARSTDQTCPSCGKGPEFRRPASTFGEKFDICINCGHETREGQP